MLISCIGFCSWLHNLASFEELVVITGEVCRFSKNLLSNVRMKRINWTQFESNGPNDFASTLGQKLNVLFTSKLSPVSRSL